MTPYGGSRALLDAVDGAQELADLLDPQAPTPPWLLEELSFASFERRVHAILDVEGAPAGTPAFRSHVRQSRP